MDAKKQRRTPALRLRASGIGPWLVVPGLVLLGVFIFYPLARTFQLSMFASDLLGRPSRFVGIGNYVAMMTDPDFLYTVFVSIVIALLGMALATGFALVVTVLLRRRIPGGPVFNVIFSLPFAYSAASASAVFAGMFAPSVGVLNIILGSVGIDGPAWLSEPIPAIWAVAITISWYEFGFAFLVLTAAVRDVPPEVIEAAQLDGAGSFRLAWRILIPIMKPSILFLVVTQTIAGLQSFAQVHILTRGGPAGSTTNLVYDLYQRAFGQGTADFGRASVVAIVLIVIVAIVTAVQFRLLGREKAS